MEDETKDKKLEEKDEIEALEPEKKREKQERTEQEEDRSTLPRVWPICLGFLTGHRFSLSQNAMRHSTSTPTPLLKCLQARGTPHL